VFSADLEPVGYSGRSFRVDERYYAHYKKLERLQNAAITGGCPLCAMLWTRISADLGVKWDLESAHTSKRRRRGRAPSPLDDISLKISQSKDRSEQGYYLLDFDYGVDNKLGLAALCSCAWFPLLVGS
jgi:hypothetical protein